MHREYDLERLLMEAYIKVLRVNLTDDTYEEIKVLDAERDAAQGYADTISGWLAGFGAAGNVYEEDYERYAVFSDMDSLRRAFAMGRESICILYRRRNDRGAYRWVRMTLRRSYDYAPEREMVMLYVEDVHDEIEMSHEIAEQKWITQALVEMYLTCLYVDMDTMQYRRIYATNTFERRAPEVGDTQRLVQVYAEQLIVPEDYDDVIEHFSIRTFRERLRTQTSYDYTYQARIEGDRVAWCRIAAILVDRHVDGTPWHVLITVQDVTEQVELAEKEEQEWELK